MTQTEARTKARELREKGLPIVASTVPFNAWGGSTEEWDIYYLTGLVTA